VFLTTQTKVKIGAFYRCSNGRPALAAAATKSEAPAAAAAGMAATNDHFDCFGCFGYTAHDYLRTVGNIIKIMFVTF